MLRLEAALKKNDTNIFFGVFFFPPTNRQKFSTFFISCSKHANGEISRHKTNFHAVTGAVKLEASLSWIDFAATLCFLRLTDPRPDIISQQLVALLSAYGYTLMTVARFHSGNIALFALTLFKKKGGGIDTKVRRLEVIIHALCTDW